MKVRSTQRLIIRSIQPEQYGLNEFYDVASTNRYKRHRLKKALQAEVGWEIKLAGLTPIKGPVWIDYLWVLKNKRRDKSNVVAGGRKIVEDALCPRNGNNPQGMGIIRGDGFSDVIGWTDNFAVDRRDPRIELTILELDQP